MWICNLLFMVAYRNRMKGNSNIYIRKMKDKEIT